MAERYEFPLPPWSGVFGNSPSLKSEGSPTNYDDSAAPSEPEPTWYHLVTEALTEHQEGWTDVICGAGLSTIAEARARTPDYGETGWTIWTLTRVYFPEVYDGRWSVASVARHPCDQITKPVGGGG